METTQLASRIPAIAEYRSPRGRAIAFIGPMTIAAGIVWSIIQPYRLTLLHPYHQGFWWLVIEPPLLVVAAGLVFWLCVARSLLADLEEADGTSG